MNERRVGEDEAWAEVLSRWNDEEAHEAYLGRLWDLEGLAEAGRRYKGALDATPEDPVARRWRDEIVRRATVLALAQLPRTKPPRALPEGARRALLAAALLAAAGAVAWIVLHFPRGAP